MLTINLLPQKRRARKPGNVKPYLLTILILLLVTAVILQGRQMIIAKAENLTEQRQSKRITKRRLYKQVQEIKRIKNTLNDMRRRISVIRDIRDKQSLPVRYLDEIVTFVPKDKMWFESLSMDHKGNIQLSGVALDNQVFARYLKALRQSQYIADIALHQTQRKRVKDLGLVGFRCSITAQPHSPQAGEAHG